MMRHLLCAAMLSCTACGPHVESEHDTSSGSPEPDTSSADDHDTSPGSSASLTGPLPPWDEDDGAPESDDGAPESGDGRPESESDEVGGEGNDCGCCEEFLHVVLPDPTRVFTIALLPDPYSGWPDQIDVACPAGTVLADGREFPNATVTCEAGAITLHTREYERPPEAWTIAIDDGMPSDASASCDVGETCDCGGCGQERCELALWPDTGTTTGETTSTG